MKFFLKRFINNWKIILDDNSIQLFINDKLILLNFSFNADSFLKDQSQFVQDFTNALKERYKNVVIIRPVIELELRGKLQSQKDSLIFEDVFVNRLGGQKIIVG